MLAKPSLITFDLKELKRLRNLRGAELTFLATENFPEEKIKFPAYKADVSPHLEQMKKNADELTAACRLKQDAQENDQPLPVFDARQKEHFIRIIITGMMAHDAVLSDKVYDLGDHIDLSKYCSQVNTAFIGIMTSGEDDSEEYEQTQEKAQNYIYTLVDAVRSVTCSHGSGRATVPVFQ